MFRISNEPIQPEILKQSSPDCGALVTFEGWVRNHNEGHSVVALKYEAYEALAISEGRKILDEARQRFGLSYAQCVHRVGALGIGDVAVWVGVATPHRDEAFRACRYIIDEIKIRVPIWKNETYDNGESGWVNCHQCAQHAHHRKSDYSRQTVLPEVGEAGQRRLESSRVLVVGAGGLGSPVLAYLAGAGIGRIGIVEPDRLDASNLHRQFIYRTEDLGTLKAERAAQWVHEYNPHVKLTVYPEPIEKLDLAAVLKSYDIVVECTDCMQTKLHVSRACVSTGTPGVFGGIYQYEGQVQVVLPSNDSSCLECLWTPDTQAPSCAQAGVLGPVPGVVGSIQALEVIRQLLGLPGRLRNQVLVINLHDYSFRKIQLNRNPACEAHRPQSSTAGSAQAPLDVQITDLSEFAAYTVVDIRTVQEVMDRPLHIPSTHIPMDQIVECPELIDPHTPTLFICAAGVRTRGLAHYLRSRGYSQVYSLQGGVYASRFV